MAEAQDLFNVGRRKPRKKLPPLPKGVMQHLLGVFKAEYRRRFNREPSIQKHHPLLVKRLVLAHGADLVERRLRVFMRGPLDDYLRKDGLTLGAFSTRWASFDAQEHREPQRADAPCTHIPPCPNAVDHSQRVVSEMRPTAASPNGCSPITSRPNDPF